jgi:hypothetical protein
VSRLYDRLLVDRCRPLRPSDLFTPEELKEPRQGSAPGATESFDATSLENIPVVVADEVGEYCSQFPHETDPGEVLSVIAAPFDRFFVECQGSPPSLELNAWGASIETCRG